MLKVIRFKEPAMLGTTVLSTHLHMGLCRQIEGRIGFMTMGIRIALRQAWNA